jgi:hypothetical protein
MILMKYSLELSSPWISKHYTTSDENENGTFGTTTNFYKLWVTEHDEELKTLFSKNGTEDIVHGWR